MTRQSQTTPELMSAMGRAARAAARELGVTPGAKRDEALSAMANAIRNDAAKILQANDADINGLSGEQSTAAFADRLKLTPARIEAISKGLEDVAARHDPLGRVLEETTRPNGLYIARVSVPIGVIGIIYESRPNVTADAGALCLKSGNAVILRGGSEALRTSREIHQSMTRALVSVGIDPNAIQLVPTSDREAVGQMLSGMDGAIDLIIPRGGKSLVKRVHDEARIAVLAHLDGVNHVYVDRSADPEMAVNITLNAKMRRVSVCGAAETLLIDTAAPETLRRRLVLELLRSGCAVRGDSAIQYIDPRVSPASEEDWSTEYLDAVMSVKLVGGVDAAIIHINTYGSHHTDAIVSTDDKTAERFLQLVDSAIVLRNASTQFADGAEFGLGAEIGIATGRLHARGPVGADQLTIYKYVVRGHGQTRP